VATTVSMAYWTLMERTIIIEDSTSDEGVPELMRRDNMEKNN